MIKAASLANAITLVLGIIYAARAFLAVTAPDFMIGLVQTWFRGMNVEVNQALVPLSWGSFFVGLLTAVVLTWVVTYTSVSLYNYFSHAEREAEKHRGRYAAV